MIDIGCQTSREMLCSKTQYDSLLVDTPIRGRLNYTY